MSNLKSIALSVSVSLVTVVTYHFLVTPRGDAQEGGTNVPVGSPAIEQVSITKHPDFIRLRQKVHHLEAMLRNRTAGDVAQRPGQISAQSYRRPQSSEFERKRNDSSDRTAAERQISTP